MDWSKGDGATKKDLDLVFHAVLIAAKFKFQLGYFSRGQGALDERAQASVSPHYWHKVTAALFHARGWKHTSNCPCATGALHLKFIVISRLSRRATAAFPASPKRCRKGVGSA